jgi:hypothetical protein
LEPIQGMHSQAQQCRKMPTSSTTEKTRDQVVNFECTENARSRFSKRT